jgi:hypothetical protein
MAVGAGNVSAVLVFDCSHVYRSCAVSAVDRGQQGVLRIERLLASDAEARLLQRLGVDLLEQLALRVSGRTDDDARFHCDGVAGGR